MNDQESYYQSYEKLSQSSSGSDWLRAFTALQRRQKALDDRIESYRRHFNLLNDEVAAYQQLNGLKELKDSLQQVIAGIDRRLKDVELALLAAAQEEGDTDASDTDVPS